MMVLDRETIQNQIEEMRTRLLKGLHRPYEGLSLQCLVFYADMQPLLRECSFSSNTTKIEGLCEVFHSTALIVAAFEGFVESFKLQRTDEDDHRRGVQMLTMFGLVQTITQTIEAASHICEMLGIKNDEMKKRDYWAFRNRLNHVLLDTKRSSTKALDKDLPLNEFKIVPGSIDTISYKSSGTAGYAVRHISMSDTAGLLRFDLSSIFETILQVSDHKSVAALSV